jgi:nicotinate phosphoribosyltransferase
MKTAEYTRKSRSAKILPKSQIRIFKKVWRLFDRKSGKAIADQIGPVRRDDRRKQELTIFDPKEPWKRRKTLRGFTAKPLQVPVFIGGKKVYRFPAD